MKLYFSPGACSLATHISLLEAGLPFETERVDLKTHKTADGGDFYAITGKGYVPALVLDDGETLSENIAILDWVTERAPALRPDGELGRIRVIEALAYVSTEIHTAFKPYFTNGSDAEKAAAGEKIGMRFQYLADTMKGDFLTGDRFTAADAYLFVMLRWAAGLGLAVPSRLADFRDRVAARPTAQTAMAAEGLTR